MQVHFLFLLPTAFLLPPGTWAGEIIGGKEAELHSRPYMAYLLIKKDNKNSYCGGFLVAENFVLTAAHCQGELLQVPPLCHSPAPSDLTLLQVPPHPIPHPQYGLLPISMSQKGWSLRPCEKQNKFVKTIALPEANVGVESETVCSVAGWGRTIANDSSSGANALREVDVEVLEDDECSKYAKSDPATMLCAGHPEKCRDSAKGDSGGPLVCDGKAQGIVSRASEEGTPPNVYTRVSAFLSWIQDEMGRL
uniref:Peptidase S1 domain-containing protein n=1 Tax=Pelodiscus sinensis TaxID=13735 RepID=K7G648_PELSI